MKLNKTVSLLVLSVLPCVANCQSYIETMPVSFEGSIAGFGSLGVLSGTLSETVTINPGSPTIEQAGTISFGAANLGTFAGSESEPITMPAQFPNPPETVQVPGNINFGITSAAESFSFDTGANALNYNSPNLWTFGPGTYLFKIPLDLSYSLTTGGQTYTGDSQGGIYVEMQPPSQLNTANYPSSISLSPAQLSPDVGPPVQLLDYTAPNGFVVTVATVPEPSTLSLFGVGLSAFGVLRRKR